MIPTALIVLWIVCIIVNVIVVYRYRLGLTLADLLVSFMGPLLTMPILIIELLEKLDEIEL